MLDLFLISLGRGDTIHRKVILTYLLFFICSHLSLEDMSQNSSLGNTTIGTSQMMVKSISSSSICFVLWCLLSEVSFHLFEANSSVLLLAGIAYLRDYLHLPPEIVPATLRRQARAETARPRPKGRKPFHPLHAMSAVATFASVYPLPFKWKLLSSTFLWCCLLCCTRWF